MTRAACVLLVALALAGCITRPLPEAVPGRAVDPYATAARAGAELDMANAAIAGTQAAGRATQDAAALYARQTESAVQSTGWALAVVATEQAGRATQSAHQFTQAANVATQGALSITQMAEWAQATADYRLAGVEHELAAREQIIRETAMIIHAEATATAQAGLVRRQQAKDDALALLPFALLWCGMFGALALIVPFGLRAWRRARFVGYPARNPMVIVDLLTGEVQPILQSAPRTPQVKERIVPYRVSGAAPRAEPEYSLTRLLLDAGDTVGWESSELPGWRDLQARGWTSSRWQAVTGDYISRGILIAEQGRGTRLNPAHYANLRAWMHDVVNRRGSYPTPPHEVIQ